MVDLLAFKEENCWPILGLCRNDAINQKRMGEIVIHCLAHDN